MADGNKLGTKGLRVRMRFATDERLVASVRRGDPLAFEALYRRHVGELLSFCVYMLGSRHDAEDAVQATFASAYRALRADRREIALRPWLFTIARNESLSVLRSRRPTVELNGEPARGGDPLRELEAREEIRRMLEDLRKLPEGQRAALVLAEMHGLSHFEIGAVLGVRADQVKAYIFQARSNLLSERHARETDCREIREELASARGAALLRGRLRRHLRACQDCRVYADGVARQRRQLGALLPLAPTLVLKYRALKHVFESGVADPAPYAGGAAMSGSVVGAAVELTGGGLKAVALKVATGVACICAGVGVGSSVLSSPRGSGQSEAILPAAASAQLAPLAAVASPNTLALAPGEPRLVEALAVSSGPAGAGLRANQQDTPVNEATSLAAEPPVTAVTVIPGGSGGSEGSSPSQAQAQGAQERQRRREHGQQKSEEGQQERDAHKGEREEQREERNGERQERKQKHEENKREREAHNGEREEHKQAREQLEREREEGDQIGRSRPPKTEEELRRRHEERQLLREERERIGYSRPPRSEEELQRKHEERQRLREERQRIGRSRPPRSEEELQRKREERQRLREAREQA